MSEELPSSPVQSVAIDGTGLEGELKGPEDIAGNRTSSFRTVRPEPDATLLPLLHDKHVAIRVAPDEQPFGRQMAGGTPLGGMLDKKNRRFEKQWRGSRACPSSVVLASSPRRTTRSFSVILPRGLALGATRQNPTEDRHLMTQPEIETRLSVLLGGYAAEQLVLGSVSSGAENDLKEATHVASQMVAHYGMSKALGPAYYECEVEHPFLGQRVATDGGVSDATLQTIEVETRQVLAQALATATALLAGHRSDIERLVAALLDRETLEGMDLERALVGVAGAASVGAPAIAAAVALRR